VSTGTDAANGTLPIGAYPLGDTYDELFEPGFIPRESHARLYHRMSRFAPEELELRRRAAEASLVNQGITFNVYGQEQGTERVMPYDLVPRILTRSEWEAVRRGLEQRIRAVDLFLCDIYHDARILSQGIVPRELVYTCKHYRREMRDLKLPRDRYVMISGTDLIRTEDGAFAVLEDNLRVPSGVSYMLANRQISKSILPQLFQRYGVAPVEHYAQELFQTLHEVAPRHRGEPTIVVLTPGVYNSAYFEHAFLARQMGVELVMGRDLVLHDNGVFMRTTAGLRRVDVIYRRLDDDFIDPLMFRPDSVLGVPGVFNAYRNAGVNFANAVGTGVADDKAVYAYVPAMIRYYLGEDPLLANVETYLGWDKRQLGYILANLETMVVKAVGEAGGYGMLIGPQASKKEIEEFRDCVKANPRNYIAQPVVNFSRAPCLVDGRFEPRHVDLRPFVLYGKEVRVIPGGLTRVALRRGSLVVNSSQGGGSKDTWIVED
jgi:uncharacterized circularly permuted ATP-grasp superfamily protein